MTVIEGQSVELPCRMLGITTKPIVAEWKYKKSGEQSALRVSSRRQVMWRFRHRFAVRPWNYSVDGGEWDFSLRIRPVIRNDEGIYICVISDLQSAELLQHVHLYVTG